MGNKLAGLELADDDVLTLSNADLRDVFSHLKLPEALRPYSSLRRIRAGAVGDATMWPSKPLPTSIC